MPSSFNTTFLQELLNAVAERSRHLLPWALNGDGEDIVALSRALMSGRGEASGVAIAREIIEVYRRLDGDERAAFYAFLANGFEPDQAAVAAAAQGYLDVPSPLALARLRNAVESPRQEFFRRLNLAPGATAEIVALRRDLLLRLAGDPALVRVEEDLRHLLLAWFNRGFLVMRRIDWQTPAAILEKIIAYEAVHEITGWDDLRRRLDPTDRRCFAFFHPSLIDEPLIFVEVALTAEPSASIDEVLRQSHGAHGQAESQAHVAGRTGADKVAGKSGGKPSGSGAQQDGRDQQRRVTSRPTTAVFYSISNCQEGLRGISFGNFLIKQVVEDLVREISTLTTFVTLSPMPRFARWLARELADPQSDILMPDERAALASLAQDAAGKLHTGEVVPQSPDEALKAPLLAVAARYFMEAKGGRGRPLDPVARFHLGNGARLERINWRADTSPKGLREAWGLMVNYNYDLKEIEANHEAFANEGRIVASRVVRNMARTADRRRRPAVRMLEGPDATDDAGSEPKAGS